MDRSSIHFYVQSFYNHLESSFLSNQLHMELNQLKEMMSEVVAAEGADEQAIAEATSDILLAAAQTMSEVTLKFLDGMEAGNDSRLYLEAIEEFNRFYLDDNEPINVTLTTAVPLTIEQRDKIIKVFRTKIANHHLYIREVVDESVLGGVRLESENYYFDNTLQTKLTEMKNHILQDEWD